jgi:hypothetical protein
MGKVLGNTQLACADPDTTQVAHAAAGAGETAFMTRIPPVFGDRNAPARVAIELL